MSVVAKNGGESAVKALSLVRFGRMRRSPARDKYLGG